MLIVALLAGGIAATKARTRTRPAGTGVLATRS
jgi:hypothetical protein